MADSKTIKHAFERNRKAIQLRPEIGKGTAVTKVRLYNGTTCEVEHKHWKFTVDVGTGEGGNDAGPGPSVLERGSLGSCLAIACSQQAAVMEVPIDRIEVEIETDTDARGMFGINDTPPVFEAVRYRIYIESPAEEEQVRKVIREVERLNPTLDNYRRALPVEGETHIVTTELKEGKSYET